MKTHTFVALSVMTIDIHSSANPSFPADRRAVALGMLAAHMTDRGNWRFVNRAVGIGAGEGDEALLRWLVDNLPIPSTMIGWKIDSHLMPTLTTAASTADPAVARDAMQRLSESLQAGPIDLALDVGGAAARPLIEIAADHCIGMSPVTEEERAAHWSFGETAALEAAAADVALGIWLLFLRMSDLAGPEAEEATLNWIKRRRQIRAVPSRVSDHRIRHEVAVRMKKSSSFEHNEGDE